VDIISALCDKSASGPTKSAAGHLTVEGKKLWKRIAAEVELDAPALLLLTTLAEQFDTTNEARALLKKEGVVINDRFGQAKRHPACSIELAAIASLTRCWRLLGFDLQPPIER
jgi:P27 family predicted phage terminase small subunit